MSYGGPGRLLAELTRAYIAYWKIRKSPKANTVIKKNLIKQVGNLVFGSVFSLFFLTGEFTLAVFLSKNTLNSFLEIFLHVILLAASIALSFLCREAVSRVMFKKLGIRKLQISHSSTEGQ